MSCEGCIFAWVKDPTQPSDSQYCQVCKRNPNRNPEIEKMVAEKYEITPPFDLFMSLESINILITILKRSGNKKPSKI